jgi:hypothetical protein
MMGGGSSCQQCGGAGQPCCDNNVCGDNTGCCDHNNDTCVLAGAMCSMMEGACTAGGCMGGACGQAGQATCQNGVGCTAPFTVEDNGMCVPCGGNGQRCCTGRGDSCGSGFVCNGNGMCEACGTSGKRCCAGLSCATGTCTGGGMCP